MMRILISMSAVLGLLNATAVAQLPPTTVRTATAEMKEVQLHHRVTGSLRAVARGDVAALEEGRVTEVTVREGAQVRQGDIIARVDARRLEAQKSELQASLETTKAQVAQRTAELRQAKLDLARQKRLVDGNAATIEQYQHSETDVTVAEAQLQAEQRRVAEIESQIQLLDVRLDDVVVRAPYDGRVVERHAEPGEWIRPGEPFVTLVSSGSVEAWLDVPERYLNGLAALTTDHLEISVEVRGSDHTYPALSVKRIPDVHARTRTFPLVLTLDDAEGALTPGMSVDAWIPIGTREPRLTIPKDALIRTGRSAFVYKALEQKGEVTAVQSPVNVLFETGGLAAVRAETLSSGDRVIVEGNERLTPGAPIIVTDSDRRVGGTEHQRADLSSHAQQRERLR